MNEELESENMRVMAGFDKWYTSPPEEEEPPETCCMCGAYLYDGDFAYRIENDIYCPDCAKEYFGFYIEE